MQEVILEMMEKLMELIQREKAGRVWRKGDEKESRSGHTGSSNKTVSLSNTVTGLAVRRLKVCI